MRSQVFRCLCFVGLLIGVSAGGSAATIYTFTTFDVPGATVTHAFGINDVGQIVGSFGSNRRGFLKDGATFITIDVPGAAGTDASGINDAGQIVGDFSDSMRIHGYLKDGASFTTIDVPGAGATFASGINDVGQIVGEFGNRGFLKEGATFT